METEWKYQISLKLGDHMINARAANIEEFKQRVVDAVGVMDSLRPKEQDSLPFDGPELPKKDVQEVKCQFCGGIVWDNTKKKLSPKSPDYKCRDKSCDAAAWIGKDGSLRWSKK